MSESGLSQKTQEALHGGKLSSARLMSRRVKAQYVVIQNDLSVEQRRSFRSRIARLSGMVRQIEDATWHQLIGHKIRNPKRDYLRGEQHIRAVLTLKMTRANKEAPILAGLAIKE